MADVKFDNFDGGYAAPGGARVSRLVNLAGAVCSVALIIGLGVWGYQLAARDVNGIPVFRALAGPLRIAPDNPGGDVMAHQGLSVNAIASAGIAMPLPDNLTLAPKSAALMAEDVAGLVGSTEVAVEMPLEQLSADLADPVDDMLTGSTDIAVSDIAASELIAAPAVEAAPPSQADAVALALAEALSDGAEPLTALIEATDQQPVLVKSVRPRSRPASGDVAADVTDVQNVAALAPLEIDPSQIATGTRLVQLGAFDDEAGARAEWAKLSGQFADLISGKAMVVQSAQSGGRTFYRLRAHGFADEDEARRFCAALLAENASCIPVAQR